MSELTFRQRWLSAPLLNWVRRILPPISQTEREALAAGTVWWDAELMRGNPEFARLLGMPEHRLNIEERAFLDGPVDELCRMIDDWQITFEERDIPQHIWDFLKREGFLGLIIPKSFGGKGFSATANSEIVQKIASRGPSVAVAVIVPNSLGPGELLMLFGTDEQMDHWLPRLADGREIPAFALTSLDAGSDAASMTDRGVVTWGEVDGKRTLGMRVSWSKRYISLGPICTVLGLAFHLYDPDHILGDTEDLGITVALVPARTPGIEIGRRHYPGMQAFPNGPNSGRDVFIPMDWIIGGQERIGQGWKMLVTALAAGRGIMLPAMSVAAMKIAAFSAGAYARIREQFNLPVSRFEGIQEVVGYIASDTYRLDAARRLTLAAIDEGEKPAIISAIMKYHATEGMRRSVNAAMDVHSGKAVIDGPRNYLASAYRAAPIAITVEGANIMTRSLMIYGQGSLRCHPFLQEEIAIAQNADREAATIDFDDVVWRHAGFTAMTLLRAWGRSWSFGLLSGSPVDGPTARHFRQLKRLSAGLALASEAAIVTLGGSLKRREMLSARLGDVLSELYMASATLKRFEDTGRPSIDLPLVHHAAKKSLSSAEDALKAFIANFPSLPMRALLRFILMPLGKVCRAPLDTLTSAAASTITEPTATRDRLTAGIFIGQNTELAKLDRAFRLMAELEPVRQEMRRARVRTAEDAVARGILTGNEAERMREALALVRDVSMVDDFAPEDLIGERDSRTRTAA